MFIYESKLPLSDYNGRRELDQDSGLDYLAETDLTASNVFSPDQVGVGELREALANFARAARELDKFKKALFRKQNRREAGLYTGVNGEYPFNVGGSLGMLIAGMGHDDLFHGGIGLATESGEVAEVLIKLLVGQRTDLTNVKEEIGDCLWYLSRLVKWADTTFLTEMKRNIAKLRARHGAAGFDKGRDMKRNLDTERKTLEGDR